MTEKIVKGKEFREGIKSGINKLAETVGDTLGPMGNTVLIKNAFEELEITKDGVSVAEEIFLKDGIENLGSELVKEVSIRANNLAGDGTTTATVLAQAIYNEGDKQISLGMNPLEFKQGLNIASIDLLKAVERLKKDVTLESKELHSVAMISSNGDEDIARTITDVYKKLGVEAVISVVPGDNLDTTVNIVKGMQFDRGYLSPYCVNNKVKMRADYDNPLIFLYDGKITNFKDLYPAVEYAGTQNRPLIIVAEDVQESALRGLIVNHMQGNVSSAIVMSPGYGKKRLERLEDMGALFGAEVFNNDSNMEEFLPEFLGEASKVEITNKETAFFEGKGHKESIKLREDFIREQIKHHEGNKYESDILKSRLGKLTSGVAMIKVGATSKEEGKELLARVEDCKHAVRAALTEGVVNGGGIALLTASNELAGKVFKADISESVKAGYMALLQAVKAPFRKILTNASYTPELIETQLESGTNKGFNVKKGEYVPTMLEANITDPYKVIRIALESSVSIVGTLLTSNYAVINESDATTKEFR